jgi:hypothetical protein
VLDLIVNLPILGQILGGLPAFIFESGSDAIATFGGQMGHESGATENIETKYLHGEADKMMGEVLARHPTLWKDVVRLQVDPEQAQYEQDLLDWARDPSTRRRAPKPPR